jgi:apolipoprotein N-acyltransferase
MACAWVGLSLTAWQVVGMHWVTLAVRADATSPGLWRTGLLTFVGVAQGLAMATFFALPLWLAKRLARRSEQVGSSVTSSSLLLQRPVAAAWVASFAMADVARQAGWWGHGYAQISQALAGLPGMDGWAPVIGYQGFGWVVVAVAAWPMSWPRRVGVLTALLLTGTLLASAQWTQPSPHTLSVTAVQPAGKPVRPWTATARDQALRSLFEAIGKAPQDGLVIAPETFLAQHPPAEPEGAWADLLAASSARQVHLLVGMPFVAKPFGPQAFNALVHVAPERLSVYAKERLVPLAEYLPWPTLLDGLYEALFDMPRLGEQPAPPALTLPLYINGFGIGASICHELSLSVTMAARSHASELLVNASDDSWIDSLAFRTMVLEIARQRSIELRKPLVRASRGNSSIIFDSRGAVVARAPDAGDTTLKANVTPMVGTTPYAALADHLALIVLLMYGLTAFALLVGVRSKAPKSQEQA